MNDLKHKLEAKAKDWRGRADDAFGIMERLGRQLGSEAMDAAAELVSARDVLKAAVDEVLQRAAEPELVLAMTGTTSSAKSTLANFLIGEELLPSAVQEMSAGVVSVRHHATRRRLRVHGTALESGEWEEGYDADGICRRLTRVMDRLRVAEEPEPVQFEIEWPIRVALDAEKFGLPGGTRLTILDLPGLRSVTDERNNRVIKESIKEAVCLVAYDCGETDHEKQEILLNQVVQQVNALRTGGSSLDRMLFLLSKADVFLMDKDPDRSLGVFRQNMVARLRQKLLGELPEDRERIERIEPIEMAPEAALWAVSAEREEATEAGIDYLKKIERRYAFLFPQNYWNKFPRDLAETGVDQRRGLVRDTMHQAWAVEFERRLNDHIGGKASDLILAGTVAKATEAEGDFLIRMDQFIEARILRTEVEAEEERAQLASIGTRLRGEADKIRNDMEELIKEKEGGGDWTYNLGKLQALETRIGEPDLLKPIEDLSDSIRKKPFNELQDYCAALLAKGEAIPPPSMVAAPNLSRLKERLVHLRNTRYSAFGEGGGRLEDGGDAQVVRTALAGLIEELSKTCDFMIKAAAVLCGVRIRDVLQKLADGLLRRADEYGRSQLDGPLSRFPGLRTIFAATVTLKPIELPKPPKFTPNIGRWQEVKTEQEAFIRYERSFWTLWLVQHEVQDTREVERQVSGITLPGLGKLIDYRQHDEVFLEPFKSYIDRCIETVTDSVELRLKEGIGGYEAAIDNSRREIKVRGEQEAAVLREAKAAIGRYQAKVAGGREDDRSEDRQPELEQVVAQ